MKRKNVMCRLFVLSAVLIIMSGCSGSTELTEPTTPPVSSDEQTETVSDLSNLILTYPTELEVTTDGTVSLPIGISGVTENTLVRGAYITVDQVPSYLQIVDLDSANSDYISYVPEGWTGSSNLTSDPARSRIMMSMQGPALAVGESVLAELQFKVVGTPTDVTIQLPTGVMVGGGYFSVCEKPCEDLMSDLGDSAYPAGTITLRAE